MKATATRRRIQEDESQLNVWQFIGPTPSDDIEADLIALIQDKARRADLFGVTIGETVFDYERDTGRRVGGQPRATKAEEQRQTSWLARVPRKAGLVRTAEYRPSPVKRHHGTPHRVYQWPEIRGAKGHFTVETSTKS